MSRIFAVFIMLLAVSVSACSGSKTERSLNRKTPDGSKIVTFSPLIIPPDIYLPQPEKPVSVKEEKPQTSPYNSADQLFLQKANEGSTTASTAPTSSKSSSATTSSPSQSKTAEDSFLNKMK